MSLRKPALDPRTVETLSRTGYPEPYRSRVMPRLKRRIGDAVGLTRIGINYTVLPPGKESSMRHWHTHEDEFVFVQEGHQLINRSAADAVYLEISNRDSADGAHYTDPDVDLLFSPPHAPGRFTRRDGTPV